MQADYRSKRQEKSNSNRWKGTNLTSQASSFHNIQVQACYGSPVHLLNTWNRQPHYEQVNKQQLDRGALGIWCHEVERQNPDII